MSVRLLGQADIGESARVLSSAFAGDPLLVWALGARETAGMHASAVTTSTLCIKTRSAYGYFEHGRLVASSLFQRPGAAVSVLAALRAGLWRWPLRLGLTGTQRIIYTFGVADRFKASLLRGEPHFYLDTLGVHSDHARRGIGPQLLSESLADLRSGSRTPCFLLTHLPRNVGLYRRMGFEVIGQCQVPKTPITFWGMRQTP